MFCLFYNTSLRATGSKYTLNYAAGVILPRPIAPPIITICSIFSFTYGNLRKRRHKFVSAPVLAHVTLPYTFIIISLIVEKLSEVIADFDE